MGVLVCFHDRCFDGIGSAAVFTRFYRQCVDPKADFRYHGLVHRAGQLFDEGLFDDQENAIVDFKYSSSERLTWWFDHHQSAFLSEADAEAVARDIWIRINLANLHENLLPTRARASLILTKGSGHAIEEVELRKL